MLEETIREAHAAIKLPEGWAWGWDGRYKAALLVVRPSVAEELRQCLQSHFEHIWTHRMLSMLPRDINDLVNSLDGIRGGQSLFTKSIESDLLLWSAWWPWSGNSHVSVRLGVHSAPDDARLEPTRELLHSVFTQA